jgi:dihydrofolate reductase
MDVAFAHGYPDALHLLLKNKNITAMRKLILAMQMSLDGFIEGPHGDMSFLETDVSDLWGDLFEMLEEIDLLLLGRVMYPGYRSYWKDCLANPEKHLAEEVRYARWAEKAQHIVFSQTMTDPEWANTRIEKGPVVETIAKLKQQPGKNIHLVGGAQLAATVMDAGLVDEYRLNITPHIIGNGKSFFAQQHQRSKLQLIESKAAASGTLVVRYNVVR